MSIKKDINDLIKEEDHLDKLGVTDKAFRQRIGAIADTDAADRLANSLKKKGWELGQLVDCEFEEELCPRCENGNRTTLPYDYKCTKCGFPGTKTTKPSCRHFELMIHTQGEHTDQLECLTPGCGARFEFWISGEKDYFSNPIVKYLVDKARQAERIVRASEKHFCLNETEFWVAIFHRDAMSGVCPYTSAACRPLNEAAQPPDGGWGWFKEKEKELEPELTGHHVVKTLIKYPNDKCYYYNALRGWTSDPYCATPFFKDEVKLKFELPQVIGGSPSLGIAPMTRKIQPTFCYTGPTSECVTYHDTNGEMVAVVDFLILKAQPKNPSLSLTNDGIAHFILDNVEFAYSAVTTESPGYIGIKVTGAPGANRATLRKNIEALLSKHLPPGLRYDLIIKPST